MTCQSCGGEATARPALCPECLVERQAHGRAKATARGAAIDVRQLKSRRRGPWGRSEAAS